MSAFLRAFRCQSRILCSGQYWRHQRPFRNLIKSFFAVVGVLVTVVKGVEKLISVVQSDDNWLQKNLTQHPWLTVLGIAGIALIAALIMLAPTVRVSSRLKQRDLTIAIEIGDIFDTLDAIVIGTNCTFDTELTDELISSASIQGQFTKRYYNSPRDLDADIDARLGHETFRNIPLEEKPRGKQKCYDIGAVAQVTSRGRTAYLLAMAQMNAHGVAHTTIENVRNSMVALWEFISERGGGATATSGSHTWHGVREAGYNPTRNGQRDSTQRCRGIKQQPFL